MSDDAKQLAIDEWLAALERRELRNARPGYWLIKLHKNGGYVPACIKRVQTRREPGRRENIMERSPFLAAFILGEPDKIAAVWLRRGEEITRKKHDYLVALAAYQRKHEPTAPLANPSQPVNWLTIPLPFVGEPGNE